MELKWQKKYLLESILKLVSLGALRNHAKNDCEGDYSQVQHYIDRVTI